MPYRTLLFATALTATFHVAGEDDVSETIPGVVGARSAVSSDVVVTGAQGYILYRNGAPIVSLPGTQNSHLDAESSFRRGEVYAHKYKKIKYKVVAIKPDLAGPPSDEAALANPYYQR